MYPHKIFGLFYLYGLMIAIGLLAAFAVLFYWGIKYSQNDTTLSIVVRFLGIAAEE